ncbi:MAG: ice-binding family protein [Candidatus Rokubacteria bacterium]|nr:ice-binding family protein [Candidatus Rokubacteria bacterium]
MNATKLAIPFLVALAYGPAQGFAAPIFPEDLASFAVLAAAGVTNVATSTIGGNLGSAPDPSVGGGYDFTFGSLQPNTALAQNAQIQLDAAILAVNAFGPGLTLGADLTGTIFPGIYTVLAGVTNLSGALILDGQGDSNAVWIFLFASTLITSEDSTVTVLNVGDGAGVGLYWSVGSAATLDGDTFAGNVLAHDLISSNGDLTLACGRLLSAETQVTLIHDKISIGCEGVGFGSGGFDQVGGGRIVPEPATLLLFGFGLAGLFTFRKRLFPVA